MGTWGGWKEGWCSLSGHQLLFFACGGGAGNGGQATGPPAGTQPERSLELVGAHLKMDHKQEILLAPSAGGAPVAFSFPDERQRSEWMVGLMGVPGLFRCVLHFLQSIWSAFDSGRRGLTGI